MTATPRRIQRSREAPEHLRGLNNAGNPAGAIGE
jgi:hypothetical protein